MVVKTLVVIRLKTYEMKILQLLHRAVGKWRKENHIWSPPIYGNYSYISGPTFIHSWSISNILGYEFFCLGHLGTSRQWISASQRRPQNFLQSSSWFWRLLPSQKSWTLMKKKLSISEHLLRVCFQHFEGEKVIIDFFFKYCSICTKKLHFLLWRGGGLGSKLAL